MRVLFSFVYFLIRMEILFATSNQNKVREGNLVGKEYDIVFRQIMGNYPEIRDEDVANVAREGVEYVYQRTQERVIVEDTGLYISSLNGFPGTYSSYVYQKIGNRGILKLLAGLENRNARFTSAIGYKDKNSLYIFEGNAEGTITDKPRGKRGFGYDPIFQPKGNQLTYAEDPELKDLTSHRRKAFEKLCKWLR